MSASSAAARCYLAARRLSALTLAALATGSTRWLSPRTGFPAAAAGRCFARFAKDAAVKHAPCGPVLMPVDRGPRAARVRIGTSARGHRIPLRCYGVPSGTAPSSKRDGGGYRHRRGEVKALGISVDESGRFARRVLLVGRSTPMIRIVLVIVGLDSAIHHFEHVCAIFSPAPFTVVSLWRSRP
jgi:hypothetical protein